MTLKDVGRQVGAQYATREEWRNSSKRNEEAESEWKQRTDVDVSGGESKAHSIKNNIAQEPGMLGP